jgi:hypothetical protein
MDLATTFMRRFMKLQWMMIAIVIVAILTGGGPPLVSQTIHRWKLSLAMTIDNASMASACAAQAKLCRSTNPSRAAVLEKRAAIHAAKSQAWRRVLYQPWRLHPLAKIP